MRLLGRVTGLTPAVPGQFCREADGVEGGEERVRWVVIVERGPARAEVEQWSSGAVLWEGRDTSALSMEALHLAGLI